MRAVIVVGCAAGMTDGFKVEVGVQQGLTLESFLFAMVMDGWMDMTRQESLWTAVFADDTVICGENTYVCVNEEEDSETVRMQGVQVAK